MHFTPIFHSISQLLYCPNPLRSIFTIDHKSTMATSPVALILGAGPRVGASVAESFASKGYKVAIVSRKGTGSKTAEGYLSLSADFAKPESIPALFEKVKAEFKAAPSVVVYNAATLTAPPEEGNVLSVPAEAVASDLNVNTVTPYVAAQQAVSAWKTLPEDTKKTFIYTGNTLNVKLMPVPMLVNLAMGKSASAAWVGLADTLYSPQGIRYVFHKKICADYF
jgi:NAD(P)-dependent dehydrogenase (short-subunit alcohol dehydrogenase family)